MATVITTTSAKPRETPTEGGEPMVHDQLEPKRRVRRVLLLLLAVAALPLTGAQPASAAWPGTGSFCAGERACSTLKQRCPGAFISFVQGDGQVFGYCPGPKPRVLSCVAADSCQALKDLCIAAAGTYVETTSPGGTVSGKCTLPKKSREGPQITCSGKDDCNFLKGYCLAAKGTYTDETSTGPGQPVEGRCELPAKRG